MVHLPFTFSGPVLPLPCRTELDLASFDEAIGEFGDVVWEIDQLS